MYPTQSNPSFFAPKIAVGAALCALIGAGIVLAPAAGAAAAPTAQAEACPAPGTALGGFVDANVNVFSGGNLTMTKSAAEIEGLTVAMKDFVVDREGTNLVNIGRAGAGSQINPGAGGLMLAVGGTLNNTNDAVHIGAGFSSGNGYTTPGKQGGAANVSGSVANASKLDLFGGPLQSGIGSQAVSSFSTFASQTAALSTGLAGSAATGTSAVSGGRITFTGDSSAALQVFTIDAASLRNEIFFVGIPATANVVVNVTGGSAKFAPTHFELNGVRSDYATELAKAAPRFMWNFADASSVAIEGSTQFVGSILVPQADADLTISASGNGRVYVAGDIVMNGSGNELHAFPWNGAKLTACSPTTPVTPPTVERPEVIVPPVKEEVVEVPPAVIVPPVVTEPAKPAVPLAPKPDVAAEAIKPVAAGSGAGHEAQPLARTGADGVVGGVSAAVLALIAGAGLVIARRRLSAKA